MSMIEPLRHVSKKLLVVAVAAGTLSVGTVAGAAGASAPASAAAHRTHAEHVRLAKAFRKECRQTARWFHRERKLTAHYDKHLKLLREAEAAAAKAGKGRLVKTLKHDIAHVRSVRKKALGEKVFGLEPAKGKALTSVCLSLGRNAGALKHHKHHKGNAARRRALKEREAKAAAAKAAAAKAAAAKAAAAKAAAATTTTTSPAKTTPTTTAPKPTPTTAPTTTTPPTTSTTVAPSTTTPSSTTSTTAASS